MPVLYSLFHTIKKKAFLDHFFYKCLESIDDWDILSKMCFTDKEYEKKIYPQLTITVKFW